MSKYKRILIPGILLGILWTGVHAQTEKSELILTPGYVSSGNNIQWLKAVAKTKVEGKFHPVGGITINFYITDSTHFLGKAVTDGKGVATLLMPPAARDEWRRGPKVSFVAAAPAAGPYAAVSSGLDVVRARISIDTLEDRKIAAKLEEWKGSAWAPVKGVDIRIAVRRLDGDLNVADAPTYTTDSLGMAVAEFKRDSLPGDEAGRLTLAASVDDNDTYGSLQMEKVVGWGVRGRFISHYDDRTLFARRGRSPWWLEGMAYSTIAVVWGVLLYLLVQAGRITRLGRDVRRKTGNLSHK